MRKLAGKRPEYAARLPALRRIASEIGDRVLLFLFGSHARGQSTPLSDLDLAYLPVLRSGSEDLDGLDVEIFTTISRTLGTDDFTLVNLLDAPPRIAFAVIRDGELLWDPGDRRWSVAAERILAMYPDAVRLAREVQECFLRGRIRGTRAMAIDRGKLLDPLRRLAEDLVRLKEKAAVPLDAFLQDRDAVDVVERRLQTAIESCVNIGNHLIARLGLPVAEDYASVFVSLRDARLIAQDLATRMADLARLRNILVHLYWRIDHEKIHRSLPDRIASLEAFSNAMVEYLRESDEGESREG